MVDSQCHVSPTWFEPVESLLLQMAAHGVQHAVLIQLLGQTDNAYQQDCIARFPGRFASVVLVDPGDAKASAEIRRLAEAGATGLRLRPTARSPGADPLAIWKDAAAYGLAVSCVGNAAAFLSPEFAELVESLPGLTIVLEHLGATSQPDPDDAAKAQRLRVFELARFANVYMKIPGLGELMARKSPPAASGSPFEATRCTVIQEALRAFGPHRLMWGSDFSAVCSREGYGNALTWCRAAMDDLPAADLQEIFGGVARRVFRMRSSDTLP